MKLQAHIVLSALAILLSGCGVTLFGQDQNNGTGKQDPNVHITVHKQTDANGNIISYDSTYSYSYSGKCMHNDAYVDSLMKKYGNGMNSFMFSMPLNTPDFSEYPLIIQFDGKDFDKMQDMLQKQMNEMMQMYNQMPGNGFFCQPPPTPKCCPKDSVQYRQAPEKKCNPKNNKVKGGVQI